MEGTCNQCTFPIQEPKYVKYRWGVTPLMHAAGKGYLQCVKELIAAGADVNQADNNGQPPLMWAAGWGKNSCLLELIKMGANVNSVNNNSCTALFLACQNGNSKCVDILLNAGADVNIITTYETTALMAAATWDELECVQLLIDAGADVNYRTSGLYTNPGALNEAAAYANYRCVEKLLSVGANVNLEGLQPVLVDALSNTIVQCERAFEEANMDYIPENHSHVSCVNLLIEAGADVNVKTEKGVTALIQAATNDHHDCIDLLIEAGADVNQRSDGSRTPLTSAAFPGSIKCIQKLLTAGADVNLPGQGGQTSLMYSAMFGHESCLDALLKAGADVNVKETSGSTALIITSTYGHERCLKRLIEAGADVNIKDNDGQTALIRASCFHNFRCIEHLLKAGADVNETTETDNVTALMAVSVCTEHNCRMMIENTGNSYLSEDHSASKSVEALINAGADVNIKDGAGNALLVAFISISECVPLLLKAGADANLIDSKTGLCVLMMAIKDYADETVKLLLEAGADVNIKDATGNVPLIKVVHGFYEEYAPWLPETGDGNLVYDHHEQYVPMLLEAGADVNVTDSNSGSSALMRAIGLNKRETFDQLLKAGADVNIVDKEGDTALTIAAESGKVYMARCLLKASCRINKTSRMTQNALMSHLNNRKPTRGDLARLLFAAGDILDDRYVDMITKQKRDTDDIDEIAQYFLNLKAGKMQLMHICREAIRKHLLELDPHQHLFARVPRLGLPEVMNQYLLFDESLDKNDHTDHSAGNDDDNDDYDYDNYCDGDNSDDNGYDYGRPFIFCSPLLVSEPHKISLAAMKN